MTGEVTAGSRRSLTGSWSRTSASRSSSPSFSSRSAVRDVTTLDTDATGVRDAGVSGMGESGSAQPSASERSGPSGPTTVTIAPGVVMPTCSSSRVSICCRNSVASGSEVPSSGGAAAPRGVLTASSMRMSTTTGNALWPVRNRGGEEGAISAVCPGPPRRSSSQGAEFGPTPPPDPVGAGAADRPPRARRLPRPSPRVARARDPRRGRARRARGARDPAPTGAGRAGRRGR